jgi:hypothetical protein
MRSALKDPLPNEDFPSIRDTFTPEEIDLLRNHIAEHPSLHNYDPVNAMEGFERLLDGKLPRDSELKLLYRVLPADLMESIMRRRAVSWQETAINIANVPRAIMSSTDLSAPGRQAIVLIGTKAYWTSMDDMFKAALSDTKAKAIDDAITSDPMFPLAEEAGLFHADNSAFLDSREEVFRSPLAEKIPLLGRLIRGSERAYVTYLNKVRFDHFKNVIGRAEAIGHPVTPEFKSALANFLNNATGRGSLGKLEKAGEYLSAAFFSPRLVSSRIQLANPLWYAKLYRQDPMIGREAIKQAVTFAGIMGTLLTGAAMSGLADVETDMRHPDAYKLRAGNARIDVSGGILPWTRLLARLGSQSKVTVKGEEIEFKPGRNNDNNMSEIGRFARSKESPLASFIHDWVAGEDFLGRETTLVRSVGSRIAPMIVGDIVEAVSDMGVKGLWLTPLSGAGFSTTVFDEDAPRPKKGEDPTLLKNILKQKDEPEAAEEAPNSEFDQLWQSTGQ